MRGLLDGKAITVTGAASGIGEASARLFAQNGARLVLADVDATGGQRLEQELRSGGAEVLFVRTDVSKEADAQQMVARCVERFGRMDGAFNNAGVGYPSKAIHELSLTDWQRTLDVNLTGVFLCMKYETAAMLESGGGSIVNTGSVASIIGLPTCAGYNAAKHGVMGLTRNAAVDYSSKGIRVNSVLVGATVTPMLQAQIPDAESNQPLVQQLSLLHRLAKPVEIAQAAMWLLSDASSFVAGHGLTIDGGYTAA